MERQSISTDCKTSILLVGYKRADFLEENISIVSALNQKKDNLEIIVSVDGPKLSSATTINRKIVEDLFSKHGMHLPNLIQIFNENLGCDRHIPQAIDLALSRSDLTIVLEDDVRMSTKSLNSLMSVAEKKYAEGSIAPIITMSGIRRLPFQLKDEFLRETPYFSAWGFCLTKEFWKIHKESIADFKARSNVGEFLGGSRIWSEFSNRKKALWTERFQRGNYDYGIQFTLFRKDILCLAPIFRIVDNIGHGAEHATHTKYSVPRYLRKQVSLRQVALNSQVRRGTVLAKILKIADSCTWAGDSLLSIRGRNIGIRSILKILLRNLRSK